MGGYAAAGVEATLSLVSGDSWDWGEMLGRWALYAFMGAVINGLILSGIFLPSDERGRREVMAAAIRTGEIPDGARSDAWRSHLAGKDREFRQARWALVALSQLIAGVVAVAAVIQGDSATDLWALALVMSTFVVVPLRWLRVRMQRVQVLVAQLDGR